MSRSIETEAVENLCARLNFEKKVASLPSSSAISKYNLLLFLLVDDPAHCFDPTFEPIKILFPKLCLQTCSPK